MTSPCERDAQTPRRRSGRTFGTGCVFILLFACATRGQASDLKLSIVLTKDTFLPLEPIVGTVLVTNQSDRMVSIPDVGRYGAGAFAFSVFNAAGEALPSSLVGVHVSSPGQPTWDQHKLAAGEVLSTGLLDVAQGMGGSGPPPNYAQLGPGRYAVRVKWDAQMETYTLDWTRDSSRTISFTVREPRPAETPVLLLYRATLACLDTSALSEVRLAAAERFARAVLWCQAPEPYIVLARLALRDIYWERLFGFGRRPVQPELAKAWTDSLRFFDRDVIVGHPGSPVAATFLNWYVAPYKDDALMLLHDLIREFPNTYAGQEAARKLTRLENSPRGE